MKRSIPLSLLALAAVSLSSPNAVLAQVSATTGSSGSVQTVTPTTGNTGSVQTVTPTTGADTSVPQVTANTGADRGVPAVAPNTGADRGAPAVPPGGVRSNPGSTPAQTGTQPAAQTNGRTDGTLTSGNRTTPNTNPQPAIGPNSGISGPAQSGVSRPGVKASTGLKPTTAVNPSIGVAPSVSQPAPKTVKVSPGLSYVSPGVPAQGSSSTTGTTQSLAPTKGTYLSPGQQQTPVSRTTTATKATSLTAADLTAAEFAASESDLDDSDDNDVTRSIQNATIFNLMAGILLAVAAGLAVYLLVNGRRMSHR